MKHFMILLAMICTMSAMGSDVIINDDVNVRAVEVQAKVDVVKCLKDFSMNTCYVPVDLGVDIVSTLDTPTVKIVNNEYGCSVMAQLTSKHMVIYAKESGARDPHESGKSCLYNFRERIENTYVSSLFLVRY